MTLEIDLDDEAAGADSDDDYSLSGGEEEVEEQEGASGAGTEDGAAVRPRWKRQEFTYSEFAACWVKLAGKAARDAVPAALAWCDIVSYIKGSAEAVRTPTGRLTLEQYQGVGRKRAPNFDDTLRPLVYDVLRNSGIPAVRAAQGGNGEVRCGRRGGAPDEAHCGRRVAGYPHPRHLPGRGARLYASGAAAGFTGGGGAECVVVLR
jgi:hypothetical protein